MKRRAAVVVLLWGLAQATMHAQAQTPPGAVLVLVTAASSTVPALTPEDVRRLYLGAVIHAADGQPLEPLRNASDPVLDEVFLQKIMFMSGPMYERALMLGVLRSGGVRPAVVRSGTELLRALRARRNTVAYVWRDSVLNANDIRIVGVLWQKDGE